MLTAMLDTSVLWPSLQRDFLLSLAVEGTYRPVWSEAVLAELEFHEAAKVVTRGTDPAEAAQRATRLISIMRMGFGDAMVTGWELLEGTFGLPDPDDEHVAAAAVTARAAVIVTANLKDFPPAALPAGLQVLPPAEFALTIVSADPAAAHRAVQAIANRSGRIGQQWTTEDVLELWATRYAMGAAVHLLRT